MSDIRKAIMARLGEFARPGVPAAVLDGISAGVNALYSQAREYHNEGDRELAKSRKKDADDLGAIAVLVRSGDGGAEHAKRIASSIFKLDTEVRDWVGDSMWKWLRRMKAIHSRPGAKAEMDKSAAKALWVEMFNFWDRNRADDIVRLIPKIKTMIQKARSMPDYRMLKDGKTFGPSLHQLADEHEDAINERFSRPGAKAEMGIEKSTDVKNIGNVDQDGYSYGADRVIGRDGELRFRSYFVDKAKGIGNREISPLFKSAEQAKSWIKNRLDKWTRTYLFPKRNASRPGAKAKMARWEESHAEGWGDLSKTLTATINGTRWTIVVDASTGKGQLMRSTGRGPQVVKEGAVDQLKRYAETARASRPGAKAEMAKWTVVMPSIPDAGTRHFDSWEQAKNYVDTKMGGFTALVSVDGKRYALKHALGQWEKFSRPGAKAEMGRMLQSYEVDELKEFLDAYGVKDYDIITSIGQVKVPKSQVKKALDAISSLNREIRKEGIGGSVAVDVVPFSRPGAKATNALSDACWQGYEAVGTKKQDGKTVPNCVPKATAAKPESQDIESEEVKAGLKLMEKADEKVSEKIRTLIKEGKPQDQAVAIALDMKRRGEL